MNLTDSLLLHINALVTGTGNITLLAAALTGLEVGAVALGKSFVTASGEMEQTQVAFNTLLHSAVLAKKYVADLQAFAANTPFEFKGLAATSQQLLAFGFVAKDIIPILTAVGNTSSALGRGQDGLNQISLALGQIRTNGRLATQDIMQLTSVGVKAWDILSKGLNTTIAGAKAMVTGGLVDSNTGINILLTGMQKEFAGGMEMQSKTLLGLWSNVQDNLHQTMAVIGDNIVKTFDLKEIVDQMQKRLGDAKAFFKSFDLTEWAKSNRESLYMVAGALGGILVPALIAGAAAFVAFVLPAAPFIAAGAAIGLILSQMGLSLNDLKGFLQQGKDAFEGLRAGATTALSNLKSVVAPILANFSQAASDAFSTIKSLWERIGAPVWRDIQPFIMNALQGVLPLLNGFSEFIQGAFARVKMFVEDILIPAFEFIWPIISPILGNIANGIREVFVIIGQLFTAAGDALRGDWAKAWQDIQKITEDGGTAAEIEAGKTGKRMNEALVNSFKGLGKTIVTALKEEFGFIDKALPDWVKHRLGITGDTSKLSNADAADMQLTVRSIDALNGKTDPASLKALESLNAHLAVLTQIANGTLAGQTPWDKQNSSLIGGVAPIQVGKGGPMPAVNADILGAAMFGNTGNFEADNLIKWCARWVKLTLDKAAPNAQSTIDKWFAGDANDVKNRLSTAGKLEGFNKNSEPLKPGDVVVYDDNHIGIYVGNNMVRGNNTLGGKNGAPVTTENINDLGSIAGVVRAVNIVAGMNKVTNSSTVLAAAGAGSKTNGENFDFSQVGGGKQALTPQEAAKALSEKAKDIALRVDLKMEGAKQAIGELKAIEDQALSTARKGGVGWQDFGSLAKSVRSDIDSIKKSGGTGRDAIAALTAQFEYAGKSGLPTYILGLNAVINAQEAVVDSTKKGSKEQLDAEILVTQARGLLKAAEKKDTAELTAIKSEARAGNIAAAQQGLVELDRARQKELDAVKGNLVAQETIIRAYAPRIQSATNEIALAQKTADDRSALQGFGQNSAQKLKLSQDKYNQATLDSAYKATNDVKMALSAQNAEIAQATLAGNITAAQALLTQMEHRRTALITGEKGNLSAQLDTITEYGPMLLKAQKDIAVAQKKEDDATANALYGEPKRIALLANVTKFNQAITDAYTRQGVDLHAATARQEEAITSLERKYTNAIETFSQKLISGNATDTDVEDYWKAMNLLLAEASKLGVQAKSKISLARDAARELGDSAEGVREATRAYNEYWKVQQKIEGDGRNRAASDMRKQFGGGEEGLAAVFKSTHTTGIDDLASFDKLLADTVRLAYADVFKQSAKDLDQIITTGRAAIQLAKDNFDEGARIADQQGELFRGDKDTQDLNTVDELTKKGPLALTTFLKGGDTFAQDFYTQLGETGREAFLNEVNKIAPEDLVTMGSTSLAAYAKLLGDDQAFAAIKATVMRAIGQAMSSEDTLARTLYNIANPNTEGQDPEYYGDGQKGASTKASVNSRAPQLGEVVRGLTSGKMSFDDTVKLVNDPKSGLTKDEITQVTQYLAQQHKALVDVEMGMTVANLNLQKQLRVISDKAYSVERERLEIEQADTEFATATAGIEETSQAYTLAKKILEAKKTQIHGQGNADRILMDLNDARRLEDLDAGRTKSALEKKYAQSKITTREYLKEVQKLEDEAADRAYGRSDKSTADDQTRTDSKIANAERYAAANAELKKKEERQWLDLAAGVASFFGALGEGERSLDKFGNSLKTPFKDLQANITGAIKAYQAFKKIADDVTRILANPADVGAWVSLITTVVTSLADAIGGFKKAQAGLLAAKENFSSQFKLVDSEALGKFELRSRGFFADVFGGGPELVQNIKQSAVEIAKVIESGVLGGFSNGIKSFLTTGKGLLEAVKDGFRSAIIDAITKALIEGAIIKSAFGKLLTKITTDIDSGKDPTEDIQKLSEAIPDTVAKLERTLKPIKEALDKSLPASSANTANTVSTPTYTANAGTFQSGTPQGIVDTINTAVQILTTIRDITERQISIVSRHEAAANMQYDASVMFSRAVDKMVGPHQSQTLGVRL